GAHVHGGASRADYQPLLDTRRISIRDSTGLSRPKHCRPALSGLRLPWQEHTPGWVRKYGTGARRPLDRDVQRRAWRPRHGLDLSVRLGGAEAALAAADGAHGGDRRLRPDRAGGRFGRVRRPDHHRAARGRELGAEWPEEVDRQRHLRRSDDYLGARRRRQPGQRFRGREGYTWL